MTPPRRSANQVAEGLVDGSNEPAISASPIAAASAVCQEMRGRRPIRNARMARPPPPGEEDERKDGRLAGDADGGEQPEGGEPAARVTASCPGQVAGEHGEGGGHVRAHRGGTLADGREAGEQQGGEQRPQRPSPRSRPTR